MGWRSSVVWVCVIHIGIGCRGGRESLPACSISICFINICSSMTNIIGIIMLDELEPSHTQIAAAVAARGTGCAIQAAGHEHTGKHLLKVDALQPGGTGSSGGGG